MKATVVAVALCLAGTLPATPLSAQHAPLPTPESVLGFAPGADYKLARYEESVAYFRKLAAATDRMKLLEVGKTSEGRPWVLAVISSPENLADLERLRATAQRIAHPDGLTDAEARRLAADGKVFVDISGGLHASEVAGAQHTIQLAYDILSRADEPKVRRILDDVVLLLWPSLNPDGQDIVVDWYRENVGTPYETAPLHELYQKYIGHDNNRDAYMLNVPESRVITRTWRHWEPQVIHVHHQSSPFPTRIWLPPFAEPIATRVPPLMSREVNTIGMTIAQELEANGQPGATHMGTGYDAWYPGYIDYLPMLQNIASFWTETALYRYATPYFYTIEDFPKNDRDLRPESLYPSPWKGGWWRLRDAVDYMRTASMAVLDYASKYREELLYNRYQAGRDATLRYRKEPPFAYLVAPEQHDPSAAPELLRRLAFNGVRISRLARAAALEGATWPAGTWVIPMDQEFAELVRQVLEPQRYPDLREYPEGPPEQPYDAAGWSLPLQMGVKVVEARSPLTPEFRAALQPVRGEPVDWRTAEDAPFATDSVAAGVAPPAGRITGGGGELALDPAQTSAFQLVGRSLAAGGTVRFDPARGRYLVSGVAGDRLQRWVSQLGIQATRTGDARGVVLRPRIAIYKPWRASMDEGWTRWLFDRFELPYTSITNTEIQAGDLGDRFDTIILASDPPAALLDGYAKGAVPPRYEGGIGEAGVRALDAFVRGGGTLVAMNQAADFAIRQLRLPVNDVVDSLPRKQFFTGGSLLEVTTDPAHPVMAGMPARASIFVDQSPVFTTTDGFEGFALARYERAGSPLASGYLLGEKYLQGYAAALDAKHGAGHVVLLGFRPQWRGQPYGTFRVLFNAALYGRGVAERAKGTAGFWARPAAPAAASVAGGDGAKR